MPELAHKRQLTSTVGRAASGTEFAARHSQSARVKTDFLRNFFFVSKIRIRLNPGLKFCKKSD